MSGTKILDKNDIQALKQTEANLNEALNVVQKMEECGVDCQEFRAQIAETIERSTKLRQNFGPESI